MRTITGKELDKALLKSQGMTWDGMPIPKLKVEDAILLDNLHLFDEDGYLIRAAMLVFYKDSEKWVIGAYVKIGYQDSGSRSGAKMDNGLIKV